MNEWMKKNLPSEEEEEVSNNTDGEGIGLIPVALLI